MAAPVFQAVGAQAAGTAAITVSWPTHVSGDVGLLVVEHSGADTTTAAPSGWTEVTGSPLVDLATTAGSKLRVYWRRATSSAMAAASVADAGDHQVARIFTFRGCISAGNPFESVATATATTASTVATTPNVTTQGDNLLVWVVSRPDDSTSVTSFSPPASTADVTGIAEAGEAGTNTGNGGGFAVVHGRRLLPGSNNVFEITKSTSRTHAIFTLVLRGPTELSASAVPFSGAGTRVDGTGGLPAGWVPYPEIYGGGTMFATSGTTVYHSSDGVTWSSATAPVSVSAFGGTAFGSRAVLPPAAAGNFTARYTDNYTAWGSASVPFTGSSQMSFAPRSGGDKFVAYTQSPAQIATSPDGSSWTLGTAPFASISKVIYAGGKIVAISTSTAQYAYSTDGDEWTIANVPVTYKAITFSEGLFFFFAAGSTSGYAYSSDLVSWTTVSTPVGVGSLGYARGRVFILDYFGGGVSSALLGSASFTSVPPTLTFSSSTLPGQFAHGPGGRVYFRKETGFSTVMVQVGGVYATGTLDEGPVGPPPILLTAAVSGVVTAAAALTDAPSFTSLGLAAGQCRASAEGVQLARSAAVLEAKALFTYEVTTKTQVPTPAVWTAGAQGGGRTVLFATGLNQAYVTSDGQTWFATPLPVLATGQNRYEWTHVAYLNGLFLAVVTNVNGATYNYRLITSTNGFDWVLANNIGDDAMVDTGGKFAYGNGVWVFVGESGPVVRSIDGVNWSSFAGGGDSPGAVLFQGGQFIRASTEATNALRLSTDGLTWTNGPLAPSRKQFVVVDNVVYSLSGGVVSATSSLATTGSWGSTISTPPVPQTGHVANRLAHDGEQFILGYGGALSDYYAVSKNARSWRVVRRGAFVGYSIVTLGNKFLLPSAQVATTIEQVEVVELPGVTAAGLLSDAAGVQPIDASAAAQSTAAADLRVGARFFAVSSCTTSANASLTAQIRVAAAASVLVSSSAALTAPILLSAAAANISVAAANLATQIRLVASVQSLVAASSALTTSIRPSAAVQIVTTVTGALTTSIRLTATAQALTTSTSALLTGVRFVASVSGLATTTAGLTNQIRLSAISSGMATSAAALTTAIRLEASPTAQTNRVNATLNTGIPLAALAQVVAAQTSALSVQTRFAAQAVVQSAAAATLGGAAAVLEATCASTTSASGILSAQIEFASAIQAQAATSASLTVGVLMSASRTALTTATAALIVGVRFASAATAQATAAAALLTGVRFAASPTAQTNTIIASLNTGIPLSGAASISAAHSAGLTTSIRLSATATAQTTAVPALEVGAAALVGQVSTQSLTQASLTTSIRAASAVGSSVSAVSALSTSIRLVASPTAQTNTVLAQLSTGETVAASAAARSSAVVAILTTGTRFVAQAQARTQVSASLSEGAALFVFGQAQATAGGALSTEIPLEAVVGGDTQVSAAIAAGVLLQAAAQAEPSVFADLDTATRFASLSEVAAYAYADLATDILLQADAQAQVSLAGVLSQALTNLGRSGFALTVPAELRTMSVAANDSVVVVPDEIRGVVVPYAERRIAVPAETPQVFVTID